MRISDWSSDVCSSDLTRDAFAPVFGLQFDKKQDLRYGENPHQGAAFYSERNPEAGTISAATQLQGKELSNNNIADADAADECVKDLARPGGSEEGRAGGECDSQVGSSWSQHH